MSDNAIVFIDGGYLNLVAKALFDKNLPKYDIYYFAINLAKEQNLWCEKILYNFLREDPSALGGG